MASLSEGFGAWLLAPKSRFMAGGSKRKAKVGVVRGVVEDVALMKKSSNVALPPWMFTC